MNWLRASAGRLLLTLSMVFCAAILGWIMWDYYMEAPWTRDGSVAADVVQVSADVSGLVTDVRVHDNQFVHSGDILFLVDQERYAAQLAQADAAIANARAAIANAQATLDNARRQKRRYLSLGDLVSQEVRDQHVTTVEQAAAALQQAQANLGQAQANREIAAINLRRSAVRAQVNGYVTGFSLRPGDYVGAGSARFALLDTDSYYVVGYFEENKLHRFRLGDKVRVNLLGDRRPLWGHVQSLAAGITDRQQNQSGVLLPNITPTFNWVRLAQRVPVRVAIDRIPPGLRLVAGRTATVTILPGTPDAGPRRTVASAPAPTATAADHLHDETPR
ncbi:HlyD family secretion protein [Sphingobium sp. H39-3-25]|uniref:efflux RND transporter periplasmic adaptor subunit n=1 Tax=Sphingomonadales TaxID=204457 RepID=UPI000A01ABC1|nr:HlyD family secretion protein [Novosphingobium naphthalenivorans]MDF0545196.1 HlyD family secretion protein [Sphingobium arseniciresistens]